jgi:hypothetical protein
MLNSEEIALHKKRQIMLGNKEQLLLVAIRLVTLVDILLTDPSGVPLIDCSQCLLMNRIVFTVLTNEPDGIYSVLRNIFIARNKIQKCNREKKHIFLADSYFLILITDF